MQALYGKICHTNAILKTIKIVKLKNLLCVIQLIHVLLTFNYFLSDIFFPI